MITISRFDAPASDYCDACEGPEERPVAVLIECEVRGRKIQMRLCAEHAKACVTGLRLLTEDPSPPIDCECDECDDYEIDCGGDDCDRT